MKILFYDIETAPNLGYVWAKWQQDVIEYQSEWYMLSVAWKWQGGKVESASLPEFERYATEPDNDFDLVKVLHDLFNEADVTITHNGIDFDRKKANSRFLVHGFPPPPPRKEIDTLKTARRQFSFNSNRLADLCKMLDLPHKGDPGGFKTWLGCMNGDEKAWQRMVRYNKRDVAILEKLYERLRPWVPNHPNLNIYGDRPDSCPRCGHTKLWARGYRVANVTRRRTFQCQKCGGYTEGREIHNTRIKYRSV